MSRTAAEGLALIYEKDDMITALEVNSETDFVAKQRFYKFCKEVSEINFSNKNLILKN